jgi:hypothetical protein
MLEFRKFDSDDNFSTMGDHLDVTSIVYYIILNINNTKFRKLE